MSSVPRQFRTPIPSRTRDNRYSILHHDVYEDITSDVTATSSGKKGKEAAAAASPGQTQSRVCFIDRGLSQYGCVPNLRETPAPKVPISRVERLKIITKLRNEHLDGTERESDDLEQELGSESPGSPGKKKFVNPKGAATSICGLVRGARYRSKQGQVVSYLDGTSHEGIIGARRYNVFLLQELLSMPFSAAAMDGKKKVDGDTSENEQDAEHDTHFSPAPALQSFDYGFDLGSPLAQLAMEGEDKFLTEFVLKNFLAPNNMFQLDSSLEKQLNAKSTRISSAFMASKVVRLALSEAADKAAQSRISAGGEGAKKGEEEGAGRQSAASRRDVLLEAEVIELLRRASFVCQERKKRDEIVSQFVSTSLEASISDAFRVCISDSDKRLRPTTLTLANVQAMFSLVARMTQDPNGTTEPKHKADKEESALNTALAAVKRVSLLHFLEMGKEHRESSPLSSPFVGLDWLDMFRAFGVLQKTVRNLQNNEHDSSNTNEDSSANSQSQLQEQQLCLNQQSLELRFPITLQGKSMPVEDTSLDEVVLSPQAQRLKFIRQQAQAAETAALHLAEETALTSSSFARIRNDLQNVCDELEHCLVKIRINSPTEVVIYSKTRKTSNIVRANMKRLLADTAVVDSAITAGLSSHVLSFAAQSLREDSNFEGLHCAAHLPSATKPNASSNALLSADSPTATLAINGILESRTVTLWKLHQLFSSHEQQRETANIVPLEKSIVVHERQHSSSAGSLSGAIPQRLTAIDKAIDKALRDRSWLAQLSAAGAQWVTASATPGNSRSMGLAWFRGIYELGNTCSIPVKNDSVPWPTTERFCRGVMKGLQMYNFEDIDIDDDGEIMFHEAATLQDVVKDCVHGPTPRPLFPSVEPNSNRSAYFPAHPLQLIFAKTAGASGAMERFTEVEGRAPEPQQPSATAEERESDEEEKPARPLEEEILQRKEEEPDDEEKEPTVIEGAPASPVAAPVQQAVEYPLEKFSDWLVLSFAFTSKHQSMQTSDCHDHSRYEERGGYHILRSPHPDQKYFIPLGFVPKCGVKWDSRTVSDLFRKETEAVAAQ